MEKVVKETPDERIVRLARVARAKGVQVFQEIGSGRWFATSTSRPGTVHHVTGFSCSCEGFTFSGACSHHSALLDRLGWLPRVETESPVMVDCGSCGGSGQIWSEGSWSPDQCWYCSGTGQVDVVIDHIAPNNIVEFPQVERPRPAA